MKKNVGMIDRGLRIAVAVAFAALYFTNVITGTVGIILLAAAGIFVVTGFLGFCPIYWGIGANTCKVKTTTNQD